MRKGRLRIRPDDAMLFHYKTGRSFLHRAPGLLKIILMLVLGTVAFYVPPVPALCVWVALILLSMVLLRFTPADIATDLIPALFYAVLLYFAGMALSVTELSQLLKDGADFSVTKRILFVLRPRLSYAPLLMHLTLSLEITSIFFRTTSTVQFSQGFRGIERALTRRTVTPVADALTLTIIFIPRVAAIWHAAGRAWESRGGRNGVRKITTLLPVLFRSGMRSAYTTALARAGRMQEPGEKDRVSVTRGKELSGTHKNST